MGLPWEQCQILVFCVVLVRSFPFLPLLCHLCAPVPDNQTPRPNVLAIPGTILVVNKQVYTKFSFSSLFGCCTCSSWNTSISNRSVSIWSSSLCLVPLEVTECTFYSVSWWNKSLPRKSLSIHLHNSMDLSLDNICDAMTTDLLVLTLLCHTYVAAVGINQLTDHITWTKHCNYLLHKKRTTFIVLFGP